MCAQVQLSAIQLCQKLTARGLHFATKPVHHTLLHSAIDKIISGVDNTHAPLSSSASSNVDIETVTVDTSSLPAAPSIVPTPVISSDL